MADNTVLNNPMLSFMLMQNPALSLKMQQQQALAQQLMKEGSEPITTPQTAAGGMAIQQSPLEGLSKALEKGVGGFIEAKNNQRLADMLTPPTADQQMASATNAAIGDGEGPATAQTVAQKLAAQMGPAPKSNGYDDFNPDAPISPMDVYASQLDPIGYKAKKDAEYALYNKTREPIKMPDGTYTTYHDLKNNKAASQATPPVIDTPSNTNTPNSIPPIPDAPLPKGSPDRMAIADNIVQGVRNGDSGQQSSNIPMAQDGNPLIPEAKNLQVYPPDPKLEPKFTTSNTEQGVAQNKLNQIAMDKGSDEFSTFGRNLSLEGSRVDNLINDYQKVQSGNLMSLHPETFSYLSAMGLLGKGKQADLGAIQSAMNTHILDAISQMKDTNANLGGGAPTRLFGAEINKLLEDGANVKDQPGGLYSILTQAKGIINHSQDMVKGWDAIGGRGNRIAGGDSMLPDTYTQKFINSHPIQTYIDYAKKNTAPFQGMQSSPQMLNTPSGISYRVIK